MRTLGTWTGRLSLLAGAWLLAGCFPNSTTVFPQFTECSPSAAAPEKVRVATYNLKSGLHTSLDEVGAVLERMQPDLVALQEVDWFVDRSGFVDQAEVLAERLGLQRLFAAAMSRGGGAYGNALLSRFPVQSADRLALSIQWSYEPRSALNATVCVGPAPVKITTVHADFNTPFVTAQALTASLKSAVGRGVIVAGDLNQEPGGDAAAVFRKSGFVDVIGERAEGVTFWPTGRRLDYVFADVPIAARVTGAGIEPDRASDHYPVFVDLDFADLTAP